MQDAKDHCFIHIIAGRCARLWRARAARYLQTQFRRRRRQPGKLDERLGFRCLQSGEIDIQSARHGGNERVAQFVVVELLPPDVFGPLV
jgi:hypothetical protein